MAVLVSRTSSPRLPSLIAVLRMVCRHTDSAVSFTYSSRSSVRLFGLSFFFSPLRADDVQCHRAEIGSRLEGWGGAAPWGMTQG